MSWRNDRGLAWGPIILVVGGLAIVFIVLSLSFRRKNHVVPVFPGACGCDDYYDMKRRLAEAAAAEAKINTDFLPNQPESEMYSAALYESKKPDLQKAVDDADNSGARTGTGNTNSNCQTSIQAPTPCLKTILQVHENVHAASCDAYVNGGGKGDWMEAMTMADYWREDAKAYAAERAYIDQELNRVFNDLSCMHYSKYPGTESKEDQQQRLAGSKRRVSRYVAGIS
jgi:hypothetical protein